MEKTSSRWTAILRGKQRTGCLSRMPSNNHHDRATFSVVRIRINPRERNAPSRRTLKLRQGLHHACDGGRLLSPLLTAASSPPSTRSFRQLSPALTSPRQESQEENSMSHRARSTPHLRASNPCESCKPRLQLLNENSPRLLTRHSESHSPDRNSLTRPAFLSGNKTLAHSVINSFRFLRENQTTTTRMQRSVRRN